MSANVETMFSVRQTPWHGLGTIVQDAPTSEDAMHIAQLDWRVLPTPIFDLNGNQIPEYVANMRDSDKSILGIVTNKYSIVQNSDAFSFTDNLVGNGDVRYETAGSLSKGKRVWLLAKMPEQKVLDDNIEPYICFTNTHDGSGAVRVCMTPIRVVCNNTLNFALNTAKRSWSARHIGDINMKLDEARQTLGLAQDYMTELGKEAEQLVTEHITDAETRWMFDKVYKKPEMTKIQEDRFYEAKDEFERCLKVADIANYRNTKYGVLMAVTDFVDHRQPTRLTDTYRENNMYNIVNGHKDVDAFYSLLTA